MLLLKRRIDQSIMVGDMKVTVIKITQNEVMLGIDGDRRVIVHRKEIYDKIQKENNVKTEKLPALS